MPDPAAAVPWEAVERLRRPGKTMRLQCHSPEAEQFWDDAITLADYLLAILPAGPRPVPVKSPHVGRTVWVKSSGGGVGPDVFSDHWMHHEAAAAGILWATEADARLAAQWAAWDAYREAVKNLDNPPPVRG